MKPLSFYCSLLFAVFTVANLALAGQQGRNGGTLILDGKEYKLADLSFRAKPFDGFEFDEALRSKITEVFNRLYETTRIEVVKLEATGTKSLKDQIFSSSVEYRFVSQLPSNCGFIPDENLPPGEKIHMGCTQGSITFIIPEYFQKLDLLQKALFIIHERSHAFAPDEPYEVKTELVKGLHILVTKVEPSLFGRGSEVSLTGEELGVMSRLHLRARQLSDNSAVPFVVFTSDGGILIAKRKWSIEAENLRVIRSVIEVPSTLDTRGEAKISGRDIVIVDSKIRVFDGFIDGEVITGERIAIDKSSVLTPLRGTDITIRNSSLPRLTSFGSFKNVWIENTEIARGGHQFSSGKHDLSDVEIQDCRIGEIDLILDLKRISLRRSVFNSLSFSDGKDISITDSKIENAAILASHVRIRSSAIGTLHLSSEATNEKLIQASELGHIQIYADRLSIRDSKVNSAEFLNIPAIVLASTKLHGHIRFFGPFEKADASDTRLDLMSVQWNHGGGINDIFGQVSIADADIVTLRETRFGKPGQIIRLNGRGKKYRIRARKIRSQKDLDRSAAN